MNWKALISFDSGNIIWEMEAGQGGVTCMHVAQVLSIVTSKLLDNPLSELPHPEPVELPEGWEETRDGTNVELNLATGKSYSKNFKHGDEVVCLTCDPTGAPTAATLEAIEAM